MDLLLPACNLTMEYFHNDIAIEILLLEKEQFELKQLLT
jgi:hypothetical protein